MRRKIGTAWSLTGPGDSGGRSRLALDLVARAAQMLVLTGEAAAALEDEMHIQIDIVGALTVGVLIEALAASAIVAMTDTVSANDTK